MRGSTTTSRDRALAGLAERQHGVVARRQLVALGLGSRAIERMVAAGRLLVVHRGVYAVGYRNRTRESRFMAATLATGGVLSHRSAGALRTIVRYDGPIEVTVPVKRRGRAGLLVHCGHVPPDERTTVAGIPVTTTPRTLLDLASVLPPGRLARAVNQAEVLRLTDELSVPDLLERYPGRRGMQALQALEYRGGEVLRSELEIRFLALVERFGLPRPHTNATRSGYEVDAVWLAQRLIVEVDGREVHATRQAFEADRERDRRLAVQGWRTVRVTHRQLASRPDAIADDLRALLR